MAIKRIETVLVTPALAQRWLDKGFKNRPVAAARVNAYAEEMSAGRWKETGEVMMLAPEGLIEGQHRCLAVIKSGVAIRCVVVHHDSAEVFNVIGTGAARRASDVLAARTGNYAAGAAIVRLVMAAEDRGMNLGGNVAGRLTNADVLDRWDADADELSLATARAVTVAKAIRGCGVGPAGFFFYAFADRPWIEDALRGAVSGADMAAGHPILTVRNRLMSDVDSHATFATVRVALWLSVARALDEGRSLVKIPIPVSFPYHILAGTRVAVRASKRDAA